MLQKHSTTSLNCSSLFSSLSFSCTLSPPWAAHQKQHHISTDLGSTLRPSFAKLVSIKLIRTVCDCYVSHFSNYLTGEYQDVNETSETEDCHGLGGPEVDARRKAVVRRRKAQSQRRYYQRCVVTCYPFAYVTDLLSETDKSYRERRGKGLQSEPFQFSVFLIY